MTLYCYNYVNYVSTSAAIIVNAPIVSHLTFPDVYLLLGQDLNLAWSLDAGSGVALRVTFPSLHNIDDFVTWDGQNGTLNVPYPAYGKDLQEVTIAMNNSINAVSYTFTVSLCVVFCLCVD